MIVMIVMIVIIVLMSVLNGAANKLLSIALKLQMVVENGCSDPGTLVISECSHELDHVVKHQSSPAPGVVDDLDLLPLRLFCLHRVLVFKNHPIGCVLVGAFVEDFGGLAPFDCIVSDEGVARIETAGNGF